jgi:hypothetical protein
MEDRERTLELFDVMKANGHEALRLGAAGRSHRRIEPVKTEVRR